VAYGRLSETFLPIPLLAFMTGGVALLFCAIAGGLPDALRTKSGILFLIITAWLILAVPFSSWPGGSVQLLKNFWLKSIAVFFLIVGCIGTARHYRWLMNGLALALIIVMIALRVFGVSQEGRLELSGQSLNNPNDLAAHLLIAAPILFLFAGPNSWRGWFFLALSGGVLVTVLKTGSRGGLLTLFMLLLYRFVRGSSLARAAIVICVVTGFLLLPFVTTVETIERYRTMFGGISETEATSRQVEYAEGSKESRVELLKQSIIATALHPIFGVGPGQFSGFMADRTKTAGFRGMWAQTHNSFTQMSSEGGLLPGILFIWITVRVFLNGRWVWRIASVNPINDTLKQLALYGEVLTTAIFCFAVAAFFGNYAYGLYLPMLAGCGEALRLVTERELRAAGRPLTQPSLAPPRKKAATRLAAARGL
jgi:O-antigen ligase